MISRQATRYSSLLLYSPSRGRAFFTFPGSFGRFDDNGSDKEDMQTHHERKIMPYTRQQLYELVADVDSYRHFIPFCTASKVLHSSRPDWKLRGEKDNDPPTHLEAELKVGFLGMDESYVSKVECRPFQSVTATASTSTPLFKRLVTTWTFQHASPASPHLSSPESLARSLSMSKNTSKDAEGPTLLTFDISFAFANPLHATISKGFFGRVSSMMVNAFEKRCLEVYGEGKQ
ncbi:hypothetical protein CPB86DRAFT_779308 [Serendipita vermifera]|nr:hypothetical protein CPB86DRAFT_779308 [Serendipita vermifera]